MVSELFPGLQRDFQDIARLRQQLAMLASSPTGSTLLNSGALAVPVGLKRTDRGAADGEVNAYVDDGTIQLQVFSLAVNGWQEIRAARPTEIVVAASDSSDPVQQLADFKGTGTDDDVQVQLAIAALPDGRGRVRLADGTYSFSTAVVVGDFVSVVGSGPGTIIRIANGADTGAFTLDDLVTGTEHVTFADFKIEGNSANQTVEAESSIILGDTGPTTRSSHITLRNLWITDVFGMGLHPKNVDNLVMDNVLVENCGSAGNILYHNVYFFHADHANIRGLVTRNAVSGRNIKFTDMKDGYAQAQSDTSIDVGISISDECRDMMFDLLSLAAGTVGLQISTENGSSPTGCDVRAIVRGAGGHGCSLRASANTLSGQFNGNGSDGVNCGNASGNVLSIRARDNAGYGLQFTSGGNDNQVSGSLNNNTTGTLLDGGTGNNTAAVIS